jgi:rubrerythrin
MTTHLSRLWIAAAAAAWTFGPATGARAQATDPHAGHAPVASSASPARLDDRVKAGIEEALQDERQGEAIYTRVLEDHGDVRPFLNVVRAERRHSALLEELLRARGLAVPESRSAKTDVPAAASLKEACAAAVDFETRNAALYDRLVATGPLPGDVRSVFDHNRLASLDHHRPAFERCAGRAAGRGGGCGHCCHACGHAPGPGCRAAIGPGAEGSAR